ncbi:phage antirepressor [Lysinibacillus sp. 1 U-2021]|uniref:phage antirepressor n=1 Tax=Lysinibacillus sp. 1 U-2021 TaxID=3039426 RepID=UPI00248091D6|nr:phage antirepressor [Lysinibacillus sp. 1 U-2021]WGT40100.1 phage antirepressor [Lysinibacillus sp. 1 U-2021]
MNQLQMFNFENNKIRILSIDEQPWFVGRDIATVLGYSKPQNAIQKHVDADDALKRGITDSLNRVQETTLVNESGLYSLILSSKLDSAKKFKRWVTSEVLPSIRKHSGYIATTENDDDASIMAKALLIANKTIESNKKKIIEQQLLIDAQKPKVLFAEAIQASETTILVGEFAKILKQNGIDVGQKRLFEWLRENGYLIKRKGSDYNSPTQKSMELGLFEIKETPIHHNSGEISISRTSKITGKGQAYFINKFLNRAVIA